MIRLPHCLISPVGGEQKTGTKIPQPREPSRWAPGRSLTQLNLFDPLWDLLSWWFLMDFYQGKITIWHHHLGEHDTPEDSRLVHLQITQLEGKMIWTEPPWGHVSCQSSRGFYRKPSFFTKPRGSHFWTKTNCEFDHIPRILCKMMFFFDVL